MDDDRQKKSLLGFRQSRPPQLQMENLKFEKADGALEPPAPKASKDDF